MNEAVPQANTQPGPACPPPQPARPARTFNAKEYKLVALRECPLPEEMDLCDEPDKAAAYWRAHVTSHSAFNPEAECFVVLLLNTRRRVKGHLLVVTGTLDTILVHPREVFRAAIVAAAAAVVIMHNLCAALHKLCYVALLVMCSARLAGLALLRLSGRRECHGFA